MKKISFLAITFIISVVCSNNLYCSGALVAGAEQTGQRALGSASARALTSSIVRNPRVRRFSSSRFAGQDSFPSEITKAQQEKIEADVERWTENPPEAIIEAKVEKWVDNPAAAKDEIMQRNLGGAGSSWDYPTPTSSRSRLFGKTTSGSSTLGRRPFSSSSFTNFPRAPQSRPIGRIRKNMLSKNMLSENGSIETKFAEAAVNSILEKLPTEFTSAPQFKPTILHWIIDRISPYSTYIAHLGTLASNPSYERYKELKQLYDPLNAPNHLIEEYKQISRIVDTAEDQNNMEEFRESFSAWHKVKDANFKEQLSDLAHFIKNMPKNTEFDYLTLKAKYSPENTPDSLTNENQEFSKMLDSLWKNRLKHMGKSYINIVREATKPSPMQSPKQPARSLKQMEEDYLEALRSANEPR
jgi:hypothetical protein